MMHHAQAQHMPGHRCSGCHGSKVATVLDLGLMPAGDYFPSADTTVGPGEATHPLAMMLCLRCGLAQLQDDDTEPERPLGIEPEALRQQARAAVIAANSAGWLGKLRGTRTAAEFASPHGGSWLPLLADLGYTPASQTVPAAVVIDSFGIMHERDQRAAFTARAARVAPDGTLLLQFHSLEAIVRERQWTALRHGHFAYYSLTSLSGLLNEAGMQVCAAWEFDLYGGTVLVAARHMDAATPGPRSAKAADQVSRILKREQDEAVCSVSTLSALQRQFTREVDGLRCWLTRLAVEGKRVYAYGAASRAVSLFSRARLDSGLILGVADASPAKQGRRMPDTDIPVISPEELIAAAPDAVWLTLPDLLPEVQREHPALASLWQSPTIQ